MDASRPASGLVVVVPEAEPVVGRCRDRLDPSAALGAPAHVTVLFPFVPADELDDGVLQRLGAAVRAVPAFGYDFRRTDWFDDAVLWLAPTDPLPFRRLTDLVVAEFPDHPPFEGQFDDVVPHLTVGLGHPRPVLEAAERELTARLPVTGAATEVTVLAQTRPGGRWTRWATCPLG
jgi:hypothetical protein